MSFRMTAEFIKRFQDKPNKVFVSGVNDTFDYIETNMLRVGMIGLLPIDNLNGKQGNQDYHLGCLSVLDFCLKE